MIDPKKLRADCARCQALCCVSLAFDRGAWFGANKKADQPCRHLLATHRCAIHEQRADQGFAGCAHYDCAGAGQRVVEELFGGRSWRSEPALAAPMFAAFRTLRHVHELLLLLDRAGELPLGEAQERRRAELIAELEPAPGWTPERLANYELEPRERQVHSFLRGLESCVRLNAAAARRRLPLIAHASDHSTLTGRSEQR